MKKIFSLIANNAEYIGVTILLLFSTFTFSFNMFHYPYYENDEGTYMSQAWSILTLGELAPYTYWYDHAPVGWFLIALWEVVSGGFYTFGFSINSGRVLMMILHVLTAYLIYVITKKVSESKLAGVISVLIFSLSPLGLTFQRRVLLDNIMIFWFLLSYSLILGREKKLYHYILSAVCYSVAVLSKESAIFFLPIMLFFIYKYSHVSHRIFAFWSWITITASLISLYFLYAILKSEFFPFGTALGGSSPHVSLIETFQYQLSRKSGFFLDPNSGFMINFKEWIHGGFFIQIPDPMLIIGGVISTIVITVWSIIDRRLLAVSLPTLAYWYFLLRGGEVIGFYIIPLIPFLAMCIGLSIYKLSNILSNRFYRIVITPIVAGFLISPFIWYYSSHLDIYLKDQTTSQVEAVEWVSNNIPKDAILVTDNYAFIEFYENKNNIYTLPETAHYYWKVDKDPEIKNFVLNGDWRNIDYILTTPQVKYDSENSGLPIMKDAIEGSKVIKKYQGDKWDLEVRQVIVQ